MKYALLMLFLSITWYAFSKIDTGGFGSLVRIQAFRTLKNKIYNNLKNTSKNILEQLR